MYIQVSVYGFVDNGENYTEYYYDQTFKKRRSIPHHDNTSENTLWKERHRRGIITLYTRDWTHWVVVVVVVVVVGGRGLEFPSSNDPTR